jgi:hypothetical protein
MLAPVGYGPRMSRGSLRKWVQNHRMGLRNDSVEILMSQRLTDSPYLRVSSTTSGPWPTRRSTTDVLRGHTRLEVLHRGPQVQLQRPGRTILRMELPVSLGDGIGREQGVILTFG